MKIWKRVNAVNKTACVENATSFAATGIICYITNFLHKKTHTKTIPKKEIKKLRK